MVVYLMEQIISGGKGFTGQNISEGRESGEVDGVAAGVSLAVGDVLGVARGMGGEITGDSGDYPPPPAILVEVADLATVADTTAVPASPKDSEV